MSPLAERRFRLLWLGRVASGVGDALIPVALSFAVLAVHHSATTLGWVLTAFWIPRLVFTLAGGVIADRLPRREVMLACDGVRGIVEAFTAAMLFTSQMTVPLFLVTAAIFGTASAFFAPASDGLVPQTVSGPNLQAANALINVSRNALNVFGPLVSGVLIATAGTGWVFAIDAASFAISGFFLLQLEVPTHVRGVSAHFVAELRDGFREVASRSWVSAPIIGFAITNFCFAAFIVLGPVIFKAELNGAKGWGVVSACGAAGAILGSILSVRYRPRRPLVAGFLATTLIAVPMATLARPFPTGVIAAGWFLGLGAVLFSNTYWETTLQRRIPQSVFSRVRSYDILVSFVFMPVGFVVFPAIADEIGRRDTLLLAAAIAVATSLAVAAVPGVRAVTTEEPNGDALPAHAR